MVAISDKDIFQNAVTDLQWSDQLSQDKIDAWIAKYPAFQSVYLLKAVALQEKGDAFLQNQLPNLAARVADRSKLYDIVHEDDKWTFEKEELEEEIISITQDVSKEKVETTIPVEEEVISAIETEPLIEADETLDIEEEKSIDDEITSILAEAEETIDHEIEVIKVENINESVEQIVESETTIEEDVVSEVAVEIPEKEEDLIVERNLVSEEVIIEEMEKIEMTQEEKSEETATMSFADWLKRKKQVVIEENEEKVVSKESISVKEIEPQVPIEPTSQIEAELMLEGQKTTNKLDSFIQGQILNKRKRNTSKKVLKTFEKKDLVSETYAQILVLQKKYVEAIETYKTLSLKYPQKSTYFARQIEKVKTHI